VEAVVEEVPDSYSVEIRFTVPEANVADKPVTFAGFAAMTRALTPFGGRARSPAPWRTHSTL